MVIESPIKPKPWHPLDTAPAPEPTEAQQARRERMAALLLANAANETSRRIALRLARAWGVADELITK